MLEAIIRAYNEAIVDTDRERAKEVVYRALEGGLSPEDIVFKVVSPALEEMLKAASEGSDINLAQHFLTAQIASEVTDEMLPRFKQAPVAAGCVVIGTSAGDLHSLGKRIVTGCLKASMLEVVDLGVNVAAERFVEEALDHHAEVIGISAMMVHTATSKKGCLRVRQLLEERGLTGRIKIIVGGAPYGFDPELYRAVGADAWAEDGLRAGQVIARLLEEVQS